MWVITDKAFPNIDPDDKYRRAEHCQERMV